MGIRKILKRTIQRRTQLLSYIFSLRLRNRRHLLFCRYFFCFFSFPFDFVRCGGLTWSRLKRQAFFSGNQLNNGNRCRIARSVTYFCGGRITAMNITITICSLIKQLIGNFFFSDDRKRLTLSMKIAAFCQSDQIIGPSFKFFCCLLYTSPSPRD